MIAVSEIRSEIAVEKFHAVLPGVFLRRGLDAVVILIETGQQGGGKGLIAVLRRVPGCFLQPVLITVGAAVVNIACNVFYKRSKTVVLIYNDLHFNGGSVGQQTVPPGFIFLPRMNVRVVPKGYRFDPFGPERIDTAEGALFII